MAKRIALFNHKGGVSKTITVFNLGWMLALKGQRVIMVDADPQCNLTGLVLEEDQFEEFYTSKNEQNIKDGSRPAFKSQPKAITTVDCLALREGSFLLPGHIGLSEYENSLGIAQGWSSIDALLNLPGSFSYLFSETAKRYKADYLLVDLSPGLDSINQNLLMTSDYFLVPTFPDYFIDYGP